MTRQHFAFVLRLWAGTDATQPDPYWLRGSLELVAAKQMYYFSSLDQIPQILYQITGWPDNLIAQSKNDNQADL